MTTVTGSYHAVPNNPAIGIAAISLVDAGATMPVAHMVQSYERDATGDTSRA